MALTILRGLALALLLAVRPGPALAQPAPNLGVIGFYSHAGIFEDLERPFWNERLAALTEGRLQAHATPIERAGIAESTLLPGLRLGAIAIATVPLALAAPDDQELGIIDMPGLHPDLESLRRGVALWRPSLAMILAERYDVELLGVLVPTAQMVFCREAFRGLHDLVGRRIRVGAPMQGVLMEAVGARPVSIPFTNILPAIRDGALDCVITGSLPGNRIGLHEVTTHVSRLPISWLVSAVAINRAIMARLPMREQEALRAGVAGMERAAWATVASKIEAGLACNAGLPSCTDGRRGRMTVLEERWDEAERRRLLREVMLPAWLQRCGADCEAMWQRVAAGAVVLNQP